MEDHPGVVDTDNYIPSDPGTSSARASVIREVVKDNLGNKFHNNSKSSYFVDTEIRDGDNNKEVVIEEQEEKQKMPRLEGKRGRARGRGGRGGK